MTKRCGIFFLISALSVLVYFCVAVWQIRQAQLSSLLYVYVFDRWEYFDSFLLPMPFRDSFVFRELERRPISSLRDHQRMTLTPYYFLTYGVAHNRKISNLQKDKLERLTVNLLERGLDINGLDHLGCTSLDNAIYFDDLRAIEFLKARGAVTARKLARQEFVINFDVQGCKLTVR